VRLDMTSTLHVNYRKKSGALGVQSYPVSCASDSTTASSLSLLNGHCDVSLRSPITAPVWGSLWHVGEFMTQRPCWRCETPDGQWANDGVICTKNRLLPGCLLSATTSLSVSLSARISWFNIKISNTYCTHMDDVWFLHKHQRFP